MSSLATPFQAGLAEGSQSGLAITALSQLRALLESHARPSAPLDIRLAGLSPAESRAWGRELDAALNECGCTRGRQFALSALGVTAAWGIARRVLPRSRRRPLRIQTVALATTGAAATGKFVGISQARARAHRTLRAIERHEAATP